jgi:TetR/AcrR family transcriptional regulator, fatty acid metabolism regulator protein
MARRPDYRKKEFIAKVSTELFARRGYQNTSIEQIARESGYAVGTIYLYFDSKEEVLATILTDYVDEITRKKAEIMTEVSDPVERLRRVIKLFLVSSEENPYRAWVLATDLRRVLRTDSPFFRAQMGSLLTIIADSIDELKMGKKIDQKFDAEKFAVIIYGAIESIAITHNTSEETFSLIELAEPIADMITSGLVKK